jgi:hypothetical protein
MRREQLEHVIRACADIADDEDIVVIGSQAVLGQYPNAPATLLVSIDADVYPRAHPERVDVIDGAIGEGSPFQATFGYYAHGVGPETVTAPEGWEQRLVAVSNENTRRARGWCLEVHDLVLSKCVASREKDWSFAEEALRHDLVDPRELERRLAQLAVDAERRAQIQRGLESCEQRAKRS